MSKLLPVPFNPQLRDGYCLPACVTIVLAYWKANLSQERVAQLLGTSEVGTPMSRVQRLVNRGFQVEFANFGKWEQIIAALEIDTPIIAAVHAAWLPYAQIQSPHAIVVIGYQESSLIVLDPAEAGTQIKLSEDAFMAAWIEMDCAYAIIRPH